uniref:DUF3835 domain-containing protein n=1 Tax=Mycena chlorophos TaxID=658473 RepID=A0ABQ0M883_MYCCL|nr:predicted protein [Mycena chlorophos]
MTSKAESLNAGGAQALQALLSTLDPATSGENADNVAKLAKRLAELVGDGGVGSAAEGDGQLLNEEGLPIIEITEQVEGDAAAPPSMVPVPLGLPQREAELRRRERDRILDLLEEEERVELVKEEQLEEQQQREERETRRKKHEVELANFKAMKEMHRRMGKALVGGASKLEPEPSTAKPEPPEPEPGPSMAKPEPVKSQKSVKWADDEPTPPPQNMGDVVLGRLRPNSGPSLLESLPMKQTVVERFPGPPQADSDDESEPPESESDQEDEEDESGDEFADEVDLDFAQHQREVALKYHAKRTEMAEAAARAMQTGRDEPYITAEDASTQAARKPVLSHFQANRIAESYNATTPTSSSAKVPSEARAHEVADEVDLDFAQHQREVALKYHAKRTKMAEAAARAMQSERDEPYITAENASTQAARKPVLSHFQANRIASSYNAATPTSSSAKVPSEARARTLQRAIRVGKLDANDQLVGGEAGDSGSEDDEQIAQEIIDLLQRGEVVNAGPAAEESPQAAGPPPGPPPSARKPPASKFKLARAGHAPSPAPTPTPPSEVTRSSPKPFTEAPVMSSSVFERPHSGGAVFSSTIIESPSFPQAVTESTGPPTVMASSVVEKVPVQTRRPQQPPTIARASDKPVKVSRFLTGRNPE